MAHLLPQLERACAVGGETGALIRSIDWSRSPLGPMDQWPSSLQVTVSLCLSTRAPMVVQWGPELIQIYNDASRQVYGRKHPSGMGRPAAVNFPEFWGRTNVARIVEQVWSTGRPFEGEDQRLPLERHGFLEETYFTFSLSPLLDDSGAVFGLLNTFVETTGRVLGERRLATLRSLAEHTARSGTVHEVCRTAVDAMAENASDIRFALLYQRGIDDTSLMLTGANRIASDPKASPARVTLDDDDSPSGSVWPFARVLRTREAAVVEDLESKFDVRRIVQNSTPPRRAIVLPLVRPSVEQGAELDDSYASGVLIVGLSPRLVHDDAYLSFLGVMADNVAAAIAGARTYQAERERAEKLAELDRTKSVFFSNISHEFRTPLTLILSPVEDLRRGRNGGLLDAQREAVEAIRRNAVRLLKLVDGLLDFARIEAGRLDPLFKPTDLALLTREMASAFEPAVRQAGLRLVVDCPPLSRPVYVDPEMWEKIVGNLLSNALKYTREGQIVIRLRTESARAKLWVHDAGIGIPAADLPHVFERFYRARGVRGRSVEGAGIGLSLVSELVKLHGGSVSATSSPGQGSEFAVEIPLALPAVPVLPVSREPSVHPTMWVEEATGWVAGTRGSAWALARPSAGGRSAGAQQEQPQGATNGGRVAGRSMSPNPAGGGRARVLVVEDNADMCHYLVQLLSPYYEVRAVRDGDAALAAVNATPPDLVLSDVLMPGLDGGALLRALRRDSRTASLPVVLLSAQVGEEAVLEGLGGGADDYVRKPFSARELLARVNTHLELARARREAAESEMKDAFLAIASHELRTPLSTMKLVVQQLVRTMTDPKAREASQVATLARATARMEGMVSDMLSAAAIKSGHLTLAKRRHDLVEICRAAVQEQQRLSSTPIVLELPVGSVDVDVDEERILETLNNLLSNARKYSPSERPVTLSLRHHSDDEVWISVRDEGPGIPPHEVTHVFDRFHRVPGVKVQSGPSSGLGLGLYICKEIVEQHGGRIWVESEQGRGSTFYVALPRESREVAPGPVPTFGS